VSRDALAGAARRPAPRVAAFLAAGSLGLAGLAHSDPAPAFRPQPGDLVAGRGDAGATTFRFITPKGSVGFAALGAWPTVSMQPRPPVAMAVFQVPNAADEGTDASTNVAFGVFDLDDPNARAARARVGQAYGATPPKQEAYGGWTIYRQVAAQGSATYTILDGVRDYPQINAAVAVRLAWPHLAKNAASYDADMERLYRSLLDGVSAAPGAYTLGPREIVRRLVPKP
jgi:hypothetical protein